MDDRISLFFFNIADEYSIVRAYHIFFASRKLEIFRFFYFLAAVTSVVKIWLMSLY